MSIHILIVKLFPSPPFSKFCIGSRLTVLNFDKVLVFPQRERFVKFRDNIDQGACQGLFVELGFYFVCWFADVAIFVDENESRTTNLVWIAFQADVLLKHFF